MKTRDDALQADLREMLSVDQELRRKQVEDGDNQELALLHENRAASQVSQHMRGIQSEDQVVAHQGRLPFVGIFTQARELQAVIDYRSLCLGDSVVQGFALKMLPLRKRLPY